MPIYDIYCNQCGNRSEVIARQTGSTTVCPDCGSPDTTRLMAPTSSLTGRSRQSLPGPGDTACCGSSPSQAGCSGPGSCCGRTFD